MDEMGYRQKNWEGWIKKHENISLMWCEVTFLFDATSINDDSELKMANFSVKERSGLAKITLYITFLDNINFPI